jgi:hypothetical protein
MPITRWMIKKLKCVFPCIYMCIYVNMCNEILFSFWEEENLVIFDYVEETLGNYAK